MTSSPIHPEFAQARERFLQLVAEVRPELHRYCARLVGSAVDGEDIVQEALAKAFYAMGVATALPPLRPWLFRIAHNTAIDLLRRYEHGHVEPHADLDLAPARDEPMDPAVVRAALSSFLELPVRQRCAVILKDVLGHSLEETADTMGTTVMAVKAALVRGRGALRAVARPQPPRPAIANDRAERAKLLQYAELFNARNWEALRAFVADECRLDLVGKAARVGKAVREYYDRYAAAGNLRMAAGTVDQRPALLVFTGENDQRPAYFVLIEWTGDRMSLIRDYRYAPYVAGEATIAIEA